MRSEARTHFGAHLPASYSIYFKIKSRALKYHWAASLCRVPVSRIERRFCSSRREWDLSSLPALRCSKLLSSANNAAEIREGSLLA